MRCLIVVAHPNPESLCGHLSRVAQNALAPRHDIRMLDLNGEGFDPRISRQERIDYYDPTLVPGDLAPIVARLQWAEIVVFCFPVWSFGVPAILKGFFDRALRPGIAFHLSDGKVIPGLTNIRQIVGIATYGQSRLAALWMGDPPRTQIVRSLSLCCGRGTRAMYIAQYGLNIADRDTLNRFTTRVQRKLTAI